jgi:hypothetical protein
LHRAPAALFVLVHLFEYISFNDLIKWAILPTVFILLSSLTCVAVNIWALVVNWSVLFEEHYGISNEAFGNLTVVMAFAFAWLLKTVVGQVVQQGGEGARCRLPPIVHCIGTLINISTLAYETVYIVSFLVRTWRTGQYALAMFNADFLVLASTLGTNPPPVYEALAALVGELYCRAQERRRRAVTAIDRCAAAVVGSTARFLSLIINVALPDALYLRLLVLVTLLSPPLLRYLAVSAYAYWPELVTAALMALCGVCCLHALESVLCGLLCCMPLVCICGAKFEVNDEEQEVAVNYYGRRWQLPTPGLRWTVLLALFLLKSVDFTGTQAAHANMAHLSVHVDWPSVLSLTKADMVAFFTLDISKVSIITLNTVKVISHALAVL